MMRRPPTSTLFPTRRSSDLRTQRACRRARGDLEGERVGIHVRRRERVRVVVVHLDREAVVSRIRRADRKSTRLNSSHGYISYAVFCLKKKKKTNTQIKTT